MVDQSDAATVALAQAIERRLPKLVAEFHRSEPLLSRAPRIAPSSERIRIPVDLGVGTSAFAMFDLASLWSRFSNPGGGVANLENGAYFDRMADALAELAITEHSLRTCAQLYGAGGRSDFIGLSTYAPADVADDWVGGLPPDTAGWQPQVRHLQGVDPAETVAAVFDLSLACTDDVREPALIAAGRDVVVDVLRGFQTQQLFWSSYGGVRYLHVGMAEMFLALDADRNAAFIIHPTDFALHQRPPLVTASGGHLLARVDQQLVCSRRRLVGRLQRHAGLGV